MGKIKAGVVVVTEFCRPSDNRFQGYIDYINRSKAVRNKNTAKYNLYQDYMGNPNKTSGLFTSDKDNLSEDEKMQLKEIFEQAQSNESVMWQTVISFDNRWLKRILQDDIEYIEYVEMMILDYKYSPATIRQEIIRDKLDFNTNVCTTTIYNYIKANVFPNIVLADCPYRKKKKVKQKKQKIQKRFSKGTSIDERPKEIDDRTEVGHWEMDSVVGPQGEGSKALLVLTERKTRKEIIRRVDNHTSQEVVKTLNRLERDMGERKFRETFKTITVDNGTEFSDWEGMEKSRRNKKIPRTKIYYCHAYRSCERGSNENQNRMIRRFFPKGTNFDNVSKNAVKEVQKWMNDYPRKILGWLTADELYNMEINIST